MKTTQAEKLKAKFDDIYRGRFMEIEDLVEMVRHMRQRVATHKVMLRADERLLRDESGFYEAECALPPVKAVTVMTEAGPVTINPDIQSIVEDLNGTTQKRSKVAKRKKAHEAH